MSGPAARDLRACARSRQPGVVPDRLRRAPVGARHRRTARADAGASAGHDRMRRADGAGGITRAAAAHRDLRPLEPLSGERSEAIRGGLRIFWIAASLRRSEEHTSELQSLMRISYAVFCL